MLSIIFTVALLAFSAFVVLSPTLSGIKKGTIKAGVKLVSAIVGAVLAFVVCRILMGNIQSVYTDILNNNAISDPDLAATLTALGENSLLIAFISGVIGTFVIPFVFIIFYLILKGIIGIVGSLVLKVLKNNGYDYSEIINVGWVIGLLQGALTLVILMMPLVGILSIIDPFVSISTAKSEQMSFTTIQIDEEQKEEIFVGEIEDGKISISGDGNIMISGDSNLIMSGDYFANMESSSHEKDSGFADIATGLCKNGYVKLIGSLGARSLYKNLTTFKIDDYKVSLLNEAEVFANCFEHISQFEGKKLSQFSSAQANELRRLNDDLQTSGIMMLLMGEIVPNMSNNWLNGEQFLGIKSPNVGDDLAPIKNMLLEITAQTTPDTLEQDLDTIIEIVAIVCEHETFKYINDSESLKENIRENGYITQLLDVTKANKRFEKMSSEITELGIQSVGPALELPDENDPVYKDMTTDIADVISSSSKVKDREERQEMISQELDKCLKDAGVDVSYDERNLIANYLIDRYQDRHDVTDSDIDEMLKEICSKTEK